MTNTEWDQDTRTGQDPEADDGPRGAWTDPDQDSTSTHAEFDGDEGGLDPIPRRALVVLLKNRFITARSHPTEFKALLDNAALIRARLNDLYLKLELDPIRQVAYKYQAVAETGARFPTLLHATQWPREETLLLVHVRTLVRSNRAAGHTRTFVDRADLIDHLGERTPESTTDRVGVTRRTLRAIEALVSAGVLVGRKDSETFEIDPAIEVLLDQTTLERLLAWVRTEPADDPDDVTAADDADDTDDAQVIPG